jgi:hypothetical protein
MEDKEIPDKQSDFENACYKKPGTDTSDPTK